MFGNIANVLAALRAAKDLVTVAGPNALRAGADALEKIADAARELAGRVEAAGAGVQFRPGPTSQQVVADLETLKCECEAELARAAAPTAAAPPGTQAGLVDWWKGVDPVFKKLVLDLIVNLLNKLLVGAGRVLPA